MIFDSVLAVQISYAFTFLWRSLNKKIRFARQEFHTCTVFGAYNRDDACKHDTSVPHDTRYPGPIRELPLSSLRVMCGG